MDAQKRKEKIDDWENTQQGRSRSTRTRQTRNDYNPLSGSSSGSSYRPPKRGNAGKTVMMLRIFNHKKVFYVPKFPT